MTEHTEDVEALAEVLLSSWRAQNMLHPPFDSDRDDARQDAAAILASDWLAEHDADLYDALRDELAYAIRTRDEWEANAGDAEARAEAAEAETARLRHDIESLLSGQTVGWIERDGDTAWIAADAIRAVLAAERDPETAHRPCAGCDSIDESCRAVGCPAATKAGDQS